MSIRTITAAAIALALIAPAACSADTSASPAPAATAASAGKPVTLNVTQDAVPITAVLDVLSKETGTPIVYDATVRDKIGETHLSLPALDSVFTFLKAKDAGLTTQRVYLPADKPIPSGADLYLLVNALKQIQASGLVVVGAKDDSSTIAFSHEKAPDTAPAGMQAVYLVTNEAVRAQMVADAAAQQRLAAGVSGATGAPGAGLGAANPALVAAIPGLSGTGTAAPVTAAQIAAQQSAARQAWRAQRAQIRAQQRAQQQPSNLGGGLVENP